MACTELLAVLLLLTIFGEPLNPLQDEALSFIPKVSLPSNALSFAFKRRFGPSDKLRLGFKICKRCLIVNSYS